MSLTPGIWLGVYEVTAKIGEGGMGEVYQARDTTLDRDVALKVLPEAFTADPDRLARFQREAKVLASLNHPNIGAIYGLEAAGDTQALVLELIEGPTLADRIAEGPIPVDEALTIATPPAKLDHLRRVPTRNQPSKRRWEWRRIASAWLEGFLRKIGIFLGTGFIGRTGQIEPRFNLGSSEAQRLARERDAAHLREP